MAKTEVQSKKRKGASEPTAVSVTKKVKTTPEKTEKSKSLRSATKKEPVVEKKAEAAPAPAPAVAKKGAKPARKRAEDFLEESKPEKVTKTATKTKKVAEKAPEPVVVKESASAKVSKAKGKKGAVAEKPAEKEVAVAAAEEEVDEDDEEEDDQTAALLAGFDSSEDENDPQDDAEEGVSLDKLPAIPDEKNTRKQLKNAEKAEENRPGVLYVGRIPHGFFEHQMKAYFSQFGDITHLRLSRNKVTGRSKHYAFIEFASSAVADIVAKTMDKYLLFGHLLQVRRIPAEQVHAQLWKGEGRRFKVMPRNKIEGGLLNKAKTRETWEKKVAKETKKREKQAAKLKEIGYEFDMPALKSVDDVPMKDAVDAEEGAGLLDGGEVKAILEKQPEAKAEVPETKTAAAAAGTKRVKAKGDGKKAKKAKTAA